LDLIRDSLKPALGCNSAICREVSLHAVPDTSMNPVSALIALGDIIAWDTWISPFGGLSQLTW